MNRAEHVRNEKQLEFVVFCIENLAADFHTDGETMYDALRHQGHDMIGNYIVPEYDVLHTQGKQYIVDDIKGVMKERGVRV